MGQHVVIAGAGIGGVTAAAVLARSGRQVTLVERAAELGEVGAGISIWPAALAVLDDLGVAAALKGDTTLAGQAGLRRPDGRWLVSVDGSRIDPPTMVHRARLHEAITDAALATGRVEVRTAVTVTGVRDGILETTAGDVAADVVIGADGYRSVVRASLYPGRDDVRYSGYTAYRGIAPALGGSSTGGEIWGRGRRFGYVPLVDGRTYWYATANAPEGSGGTDVARLVGDWAEPVPQLVAATPAHAVLHNDIHDLVLPLAPFARGRVALLGDAAHAMTPNLGRGACAAIEDAAALARALADDPDPATALASYDAERRPATSTLVRRSRQLGTLGQLENRAALAVRDTVLRSVGLLARLAPRRR
jgi:2-polyprenyl-6-methoxyphenol hydroxylase-like FAD-dependent oxidoreductase